MLASDKGYDEVVQLLVDAGADKDLQDKVNINYNYCNVYGCSLILWIGW